MSGLPDDGYIITVNDPVNHPNHYLTVDKNGNKHECIDLLESLNLNFFVGNSFKYLWRAGRKDKSKMKEDIKKAIFYLNREVESLEQNDT